VSARRADKRYPLTSPQIEREVGGRIKAAKGWPVDLEQPEIDVRLELLSNDAFYFFEKLPGPGGLPKGTAAAWCVCSRGGSTRRWRRSG
jgi:thiamine biosynthesis protein ThiI